MVPTATFELPFLCVGASAAKLMIKSGMMVPF